jgi:hypothetical protein
LIPEDFSSEVSYPTAPLSSGPVLGAQKCQICFVEQHEPLENHLYCKNCYQHMEQAYEWLQAPLVSEEEMNELKQRMHDLTDIQKIQFD